MITHRRDWLRLAALSCAGGLWNGLCSPVLAQATRGKSAGLRITGLKVTPVALPDPPLLAASGCHGPYFLRNVVELTTDEGIIGIGETVGGQSNTRALERARALVVGQSAFSYRKFSQELMRLGMGCYAGIELACLDAIGKAAGLPLCRLLGGPSRDRVEFAAYLFFRYSAEHRLVLDDPRRVDLGGAKREPIDAWGEVRTPDAMAGMASAFRDRWGFKVFKLKGGVLPPDVELDAIAAMAEKLGPGAKLRIDPNGRWKTDTAVRIGKALRSHPLEYYEDPVRGQAAMAKVREATGLKMSTNMCVTRFDDLAEALRIHPIDFLLADHHYFGGFAGCLALDPICEAAGWVMSQHSNSHAGITMAAMVHLAATCPRLTAASDTHYPWLPETADLIEGPKLAIEGGHMAIPTAPGVGVQLDQDKLALAHEVYQKCGMRRRDDESLMRKFEPGWTGAMY